MASVTETAIDFIKSYIRHNTTYNTDQIRLLKFNETYYLHMNTNTNTQTHTLKVTLQDVLSGAILFPYHTKHALKHSIIPQTM